MKQLFFLAALLSLSCLSCKAKKETAKSQSTEGSGVTNLSTVNHDTTATYAVIVSFKSRGAGIPQEQRAELLKYVENHPKKPVYQSMTWGREGEVDYCFTLRELSGEKEKNEFLKSVKQIVAENDLIEIVLNSESLHQGR